MPIYVWTCSQCGYKIESIMSMKKMEQWENIPVKCDKCKKGLYQREVSTGTSFRLKGIGWSADGYENIPPYEPAKNY